MAETAVDGVDEGDVRAFSGLLDDVNSSIQQVTAIVDNINHKLENGEFNTSQGLSFLEMKNNMLLSYLINTVYLVSRKCSGKEIQNDPCIERLLEIRTVLEKVKPIDQKLKFQIDTLVKSGSTSVEQFKPSLTKMNQDEYQDDESDNNGSNNDEDSTSKKRNGVYVPPKFSAVHYPGDENAFERNKRLQERTKKHAVSSAILQDLCEEYLDTPVEVHQTSKAQQILTKKQRERQEYEEEYMTRLPVTKAEKHEMQKLTTLGVLGSEITDYRDPKSQSKNKRKLKNNSKSKGKGFKRKKYTRS